MLSGSVAQGSPLALLDVLGSSTQNGTYSNTLDVSTPGTYFYEVVLSMAAVGASNTQGTTTRTISSLTTADGANTLSFNINDTSSSPIPTAISLGTFQNGWGNATSQNVGTLTGSGDGINAIRAGQSPGTFAAGTSSSVVYKGSFTVGNLGSSLSSTMTGSWDGNNGSLKINGGTTSIVVTSTTEAGSDPFFKFDALTLTTAGVPEPSSFALVGLIAGAGLLRRRRPRS